MSRILNTNNNWAGLIIRLTIGIVLFPHGAQKLLGWWNGHGYQATMQFFTGHVGLPLFVGWLVIMIEFFCPLLLVAGAVTRVSAIAVMIVMLGVIITVQNQYFFMNWFNDQQSEGMEFFLLVIGLCFSLLFTGSGRYSIDQWLAKKKNDVN